MAKHTVKQGECIESIAFEKGFFWETVWDDSQNAELKRVRKNPNALLPGDKVFVPEKQEKEASGATEQKHRFRRKGVPALLRIILLSSKNGEPHANKPYTLVIDDNQVFSQTTDARGKLEHGIPPNAVKGRLIVGEGEDREEYILDLRHLDPTRAPTGVQARLSNLGYNTGNIDGEIGPKTRSALRRFQKDHGLKETGEPDESTLDKLKEVYGS